LLRLRRRLVCSPVFPLATSLPYTRPPPSLSSLDGVLTLPRYYGAVRLPAPVRHGHVPSGFAMRAWVRWSKLGASTPCHSGVSAVAFRVFGARQHPGKARFRGSILCLHIPLSTLHGLCYQSLRMTRDQCGWLHCEVRREMLEQTPERLHQSHCMEKNNSFESAPFCLYPLHSNWGN
jgi:hypothetical protein